SGGPLLTPLADGELRLVAATSFGNGCAQAGKPGVYARLAEGPIRAFLERFVPQAFDPEPGAAGAASGPAASPPPSGTAAPAQSTATAKAKARAKHRARHRKR